MTVNYMNIRYNVTGNERKRLAEAIAEFLGCEKKYLGMPSAAYMVGYIEVSKDGTISFDDRADSEEIENLLEELAGKGFHAEPAEDDAENGGTENNAEASENIADSEDAEAVPDEDSEAADDENASSDEPGADSNGNEPISLTVSVPLSKVNAGNLTSILDAKGALIKKALGIPATPIEITETEVIFPWFSSLPDAETSKAYTRFISALCEMSRNQKRVTAKPVETENEKYAFRCFLLRLGFIGAEYKTDRKILLQNLTGSSAFKSGARKEAACDEISE